MMTDTATESITSRDGRPLGKPHPRPEFTIERDRRVFQLLTEAATTEQGGLTRAEVAAVLRAEENVPGAGWRDMKAYHSLLRLREDGKVARTGHNVWKVIDPNL
jgi:hypothetical protein